MGTRWWRCSAAGGAVVYTQDDVAVALGFAQPYVTEWVSHLIAFPGAPITFVSATSFRVDGVDASAVFHIGRRVQSTNTGGTVYSTVRSVSFAVNTTVTVVNDGASVLDAGLSAVNFGILSYNNPSYLDPRSFFSARLTANQTGFAASTKLAGWTVLTDANTEWVAGTNRWVCKYPGKYMVTVQAEHANTAANINAVLQISLNGAVVGQAVGRAFSTATNITSLFAHYYFEAALAGFIEAFFLGDANTTVQGTIGTRLSVVRVP